MASNEMIGSIKILVIDDNPGDVELTQLALEESKISNELLSITDGEKAIKHLDEVLREPLKSVPDLNLLDLNLPKVSGIEVLKHIKSYERLRRIPVVILTTSDSEKDIPRSYDFNANCYSTKPLDMEKFIGIVKETEQFWFRIVKLPGKTNE